MIKNGVILILMFLLVPCAANAAEIYLKEGGKIRCFFAMQQGEIVYVLINRDTEVELDRRSVDIKKTFKNRKMIGSYRLNKVDYSRGKQ